MISLVPSPQVATAPGEGITRRLQGLREPCV